MSSFSWVYHHLEGCHRHIRFHWVILHVVHASVAPRQGHFPLLGFWRQFLLGGKIIGKTCFLMFIHLPLPFTYLIKHFPSLRSPKFLIFAQTLVSCYNLAIFWLGLCFSLLDPFPSLNLWDYTFPCFLTSLPTPKNFLKNLEAPYPLHSASFRQNPLFHTSG